MSHRTLFAFALLLALACAAAAPVAAAEPAPQPGCPASVDPLAVPLAPAGEAPVTLAAGGDYIRCTCTYCRAHPADECQVSPDGFSTLCADWVRIFC